MLVAETTLMVALACGHKAESRTVEFTSEDTIFSVSNGDGLSITAAADPVEIAMSKDFATIAEVRHVLIEDLPTSVAVWIAVDDYSHPVREAIFDKQLGLLDAFPEIPFDFNLVPALGRGVEEILTTGRVLYSR